MVAHKTHTVNSVDIKKEKGGGGGDKGAAQDRQLGKTGGTPDKETSSSCLNYGRVHYVIARKQDEEKRMLGEIHLKQIYLIQRTDNNLNPITCYRWPRWHKTKGRAAIGSEALTSAGGSPYKVLLHIALTARPVAMETAS